MSAPAVRRRGHRAAYPGKEIVCPPCMNPRGVVDSSPKPFAGIGSKETAMRRIPHGWRFGFGASALLLVTMFATAATVSQAHSSTGARSASSAVPRADRAQTVNWALSGTATATTAESANPPSNAVDGDAGTD